MIRKTVLLTSAVACLAACTSVASHPTQEVRIETPGTEGALCFLERPGYRKRVWAPKTVRVIKDDQPLTVECRAPGNRQKTVTIEPHSYGIVTDGVSKAMDNLVNMKLGETDSYPLKIVIDFTSMKPTHMPAPEYQGMLKQNPELAGLEEFRPGASALLRDKYETVPTLQPRRSGSETESVLGDSVSAPSGEASSVTPPVPSGRSQTAESLTRSMNPSVFSGSKPSSTPSAPAASASSYGGGGEPVAGSIPLELIRP